MAGKDKARSSGLIKVLMMVLTGAALAQELRKPSEQRTWHGVVAGFVPYDFRMPTADRVRERLWDPEGAVVQPQVFGVGWTVNFGRLVAALRDSRATP